MDIADLPTIQFPLVEGELEYYPLGEAHLTSPSKYSRMNSSTSQETSKVELSAHFSQSGADIVSKHHSDENETKKYKFRLVNPSRMEVKPTGEADQVPLDVRRALSYASFYDVTTPTPNRLHGLDYLCSLHIPLISATDERHPLVRVASTALSSTLKMYSIILGFVISTGEFNPEKIGVKLDVGPIFSDKDVRLQVAEKIVDSCEIDEPTSLPKERNVNLVRWHTEDTSESPPFTVPASRNHRTEECPYLSIFTVKSEGDSYVVASVFTRFSIERMWFRIQDEQKGIAVLENTDKFSPDGMPPLEVFYELEMRGISIQNVPTVSDSQPLGETLNSIEAIVKRIENSHSLDNDLVEQYEMNYRDLFTMLYSLNRLIQQQPEQTRNSMDRLIREHELPINRYAESPAQAEPELSDTATIEKVTELLSDVISDVGGGAEVREVVNNLRWDGNLSD